MQAANIRALAVILIGRVKDARMTSVAQARRDESSSPLADEVEPRFHAAFQRAHAGDAVLPQQERRTGARSFVRSKAEQHDFAIARDLVAAFHEFLGSEAED